MGASTAYHLAEKGQNNVVLLEKDQFFGQGATGRCAGGVRYQFATEFNIRLSLESLPMLERFEEEIGGAVDYRKIGYLFLLTEEEDLPIFRSNLKLQRSLGVPTQWLNRDQIRRKLPMMNLEDLLGGTICSEDGIADPNGVVMGYIQAARRLGVKTLSGVEVVGIKQKSGEISGVETREGSIATHLVVNATGPWASVVGKMAGISIPVTPLRRQWFTTTLIPNLPPDFPFVIDFAQSLYFHPEGEGLLTGMSNPDEEPGFDQSVDTDWELAHMKSAIERLPILETAGLTSRLAGLYENTPDAHPIFGKTPLEGFYVVTGFSGHGFMHGPIAGKLMSEIILHGKSTTVDVSSLDLARFEEGRLIPEYNVV